MRTRFRPRDRHLLPLGSGGHYQLAVQQFRTPFSGSLKTADVASHLREYVDLTTASGFIMCFRDGKVSRPFYADLLSGSLEVAARARRPFLQSFGPNEPASRNNKFSKYNKFLSFFPSSFIFVI